METIVIILIDLGTDMLPGISLAYEEAEDRVMEIPPRTANDHLIAPRMIVMGYVWTGVLETFFSYWAFYWTFYDYGFTFSSTIGANDRYRDDWNNLNDHYKKVYFDMCMGNTKTQHMCLDMPSFMPHIAKVVDQAQAAYFITLVTMQFANLLNRRNQTQSVFDPTQVINWRMLASIVASTVFMVIIVYVPGLNNAFFLSDVSSANACSALWGIPVIILQEEIRKAIARKYPDGMVARYTVY
jgi:sodium/potassium-transporting ATPase subunit alpha